MSNHQPSYYLLISLLIFIVINLLILNLKVFLTPQIFKSSQMENLSSSPTPSSFLSSKLSSSSNCPTSCLAAIEQATASSQSNISQKTTVLPQTVQPILREFFIPLGTGSTVSSQWENITASETIIDTGNYPNIKNAHITYSLRNPTQNGSVEAELYNVTDSHPVWGSHVVMSNSEEQTITSDKIVLSSGAKLYRVRLKSTLSYQAFLDGAKIKIVVD